MGRVYILIGTALAGMFPIFGAFLARHGWDAVQVCGARGLIGSFVLLLLLRGRVGIPRAGWMWTLIVAASFSIGGYGYLFATTKAPAAIVVSVMFVAPLWVVLYDRIVHARRGARDFLAVALGLLGVVVISWESTSQQVTEALGPVLALALSGVLAMFTIATRKAQEAGVDPKVAAFYALLGMAFAFGWKLSSVTLSPASFSLALMTGVASGGLCLWMLISGIAKVTSNAEAGILQYSEIAFVVVLSWILLGQHLSLHAAIGIFLIFLAGVITTRTLQHNNTPLQAAG